MRKRQYSLFIQVGGRHKRVVSAHGSLEVARRLFQASLLAGAMVGLRTELRPVFDEDRPPVDAEAVKLFNQGTFSKFPLPDQA